MNISDRISDRNVAASHQTTRVAKVVHVIETVSLRGAGTDRDPIREVIQYWSFDGVLLAERDEGLDEHRALCG